MAFPISQFSPQAHQVLDEENGTINQWVPTFNQHISKKGLSIHISSLASRYFSWISHFFPSFSIPFSNAWGFCHSQVVPYGSAPRTWWSTVGRAAATAPRRRPCCEGARWTSGWWTLERSGWERRRMGSYGDTMWGPLDISWFINPINYSYKYHSYWSYKPT